MINFSSKKQHFLSIIATLVIVNLTLQTSFAQNKIDLFIKPSDTLNSSKFKTLVISQSAITATGLIGLHQLWYKNYPQSSFHFINDNADWLQMDKMGHVFTAYHIGRASAESYQWAGASKKSQLIYGATLGFTFLTIVEIFDGYSAEWGASSGDLIANTAGTALYIGQELLWNEQRITPKFSFHTTKYAELRPNILGKSFSEQILKDYNGQSYWLSANVKSFFKTAEIPKWINLAVGFGADGMLAGNESTIVPILTTQPERFRQFYLSFDVDLSKIKTKSHLLKTLFSVFNTIKIPAPTIEIRSSGQLKWHAFYF
jgi:hypothetical protein